MHRVLLLSFALLISLLAVAPSQEAKPIEEENRVRWPGQQDDKSILLPTQWSLKPVGEQIKLGDLPSQIVMHPAEPFAAIIHSGWGEHEIIAVDLKSGDVVSRTVLPRCFYGLAFSPDGSRLYASGGEDEVVHSFSFKEGLLGDAKKISIVPASEKFLIGGVAVSADGKKLFAAGTFGGGMAVVNLDDTEKVTKIDLGKDSYPYTFLPTPDPNKVLVSLWGAAKVAEVDLTTNKIIRTLPARSHPTEMLFSKDGKRLFVACADTNEVVVYEYPSGKEQEVISAALYPTADHGSTPNSIALSADGKVLLVANADNNNVAVINVSEPGASQSLGFIPAGWYPTSVRFDDQGRILIANGKGLMPKANRQGPNPENDPPKTVREYIGGLFRGTLSIVDSPSPDQMAKYTRTAYECSPLREDKAPVTKPRAADNPIPAKLGDKSPIKYCIYIVKENRTYDQVFGDMPKGNGDKSICIFPEKVTPNHHKLATEYVQLDNFYVESEVSVDGHEWSMAAYANDFIEKSWPLSYRGGRGKVGYTGEAATEIGQPSSGYIWDRCKEAGVSFYSFGEFIANGPKPGDPGRAKVPALEGHFDPLFRSYDLDYMDIDRAKRFIVRYNEFIDKGDMPQLIILRLPNDHTYGSRPDKPTPTAMVADNDQALGMVVEAVSKSKLWKETAIFVVQDDAQNGSDHVDAHRTVALAISPYTKKSGLDSTMYSTASMLRTMELILGLKPMSQFDAAATPMYNAFHNKPDTSPYKHIPSNIDLTAKNGKDAWGAEISMKLDFSKEDIADDLLLNEVVWRSVRGPDSVMPAPKRAAFVFTHGEDEDDEDDDDEDDDDEDDDDDELEREDD